jgi:hypothetical protein
MAAHPKQHNNNSWYHHTIQYQSSLISVHSNHTQQYNCCYWPHTPNSIKTTADIITQFSTTPHQFLFTPTTHNSTTVATARTHQTTYEKHQLISSHNSVPILTNSVHFQTQQYNCRYWPLTPNHITTPADIIAQFSTNPHQFLFTPTTHNSTTVANGSSHQTT